MYFLPFFGEIDSLFFASGIVFIALSVITITLGRRRMKLEWPWLAAFSLLFSLSRLLTLAGQVLAGQPQLVTVGVVAQILAFLALLQFACAGVASSRWLLVIGIVVPQIAAVVVGVLQRFPGPDSISMGALQLVAGLWAGMRLFSASRNDCPGARKPMRLAGLLLAGSGLIWGCLTLISGNLYVFLREPTPAEYGVLGAEPFIAAALLLFLALALSTQTQAGSRWNWRSPGTDFILWSLPVLALLLVGSMKLITLAGQYGEQSQRARLLSRGNTAVSAIPAEELSGLEGVPGDVLTPGYSNLCAQLRRIRSTDRDTRFVYLMGRREGAVFFLVDSEPADSPDFSPPGQVYSEAPPALHRLFDGGEAYVEGPLRDRWGVWESAFVPIYGPDTKKVSAVLGLDTDVQLGRRIVAQYRFAGICLAVVILLLVLALFTGIHVSLKIARAAAASESRFRTLFESAPEAVFVFEARSGRILAANPFMAAWLGFTRDELYGMAVQDLVEGTLDQIRSRILHSHDASAPGGDYVFRRKDGVCVPAETTGESLRFQETDSAVVFARDVTERRLTESELHKRGALLNGLADAARILLTGEDFSSAIDRALAAMGKAAGVDSAYVFENQPGGEANEPVAMRRFVWRNEPESGVMTSFSDRQVASYTRLLGWVSAFSAGRTINGPVRQLPLAERDLLEPHGVRSLVIVPIMIEGSLWGFIGFDDCKSERQWSESELSIVSAAASSIGGAIKRWDAEERLQNTLSELERFNRLMVGREIRVVELKQEINALLRDVNRPPAYSSVDAAVAAVNGERETP